MGKAGLSSTCGINFKFLKDHMKTIHDQNTNSFHCDKCDMSFSSKKYLRHHASHAHQEEKIACDMCSKSFSRSDNLKRHIDLNHKQINEFQCEYCEETFGRKLNLDKHLNKYCHIKFNTSFNCTKCTKSFDKASIE